MTISSLSNFTVLIKKIARKGSLRRKITTKKQRSRSYHHTTTTSITTPDLDLASISTCSSIEDEKQQKCIQDITTKVNNTISVTTTISTMEKNDDNDSNNDNSEPTTETTTIPISPISTISTNYDDHDNETTIRDFAYPESSPLHYGQFDTLKNNESLISLSCSRFNGCQAKALYDFIPETDHEIGMKSGQIIWIQYRQCTGWLIADVDDDTGMVPESYVEFL